MNVFVSATFFKKNSPFRPQQGAAVLLSARTYADFTTQANFEIKVSLKS